MRQLKFILAFLFVLLPVLAYGQVTQLSGPVKNNANAAVPNATVTFVLTNCGSSAPTNPVDVAITTSGGYINAEIPRNHSFKCIGTDYYQVTLTDASGNLIWTRPYMFTTPAANLNSPLTVLPPTVPGLSSGNSSILDAKQIGGVYQVDQFSGSDIGVKIANCLSGLNQSYGGTCDARNFVGTLSMASNLTISTANAVIYLPCATISTASQIIVPAAVRNVVLHGCSLRGISTASGSQGGTVLLYSGPSNAVQVGDTTYAQNTMGFKMDNVAINTTGSTSAATGFYAYRAQEIRLESSYFLGNQNQTGMTIDGTGNYAGGTFEDMEFTGFGQAIYGTGHLISNAATTDWMNASTFIRVHIDCPESNGNPITGIYGINLQSGDGNTFVGGDVEGCGTMFHLGSHAQNNTILGLRNEVSAIQYQADSGSQFNSVITGGTFFTGDLIDNGNRNNFEDAFHRNFNGMKGDWYASQQDVTIEDHQRLGIGVGNERGRLTEVQTDYGYRWIYGLGDGTSGIQGYYIQDLLNNVYRLSIGQYLSANANSVVGVTLNNGGTYTSSTPPTITFSGGGGTGAAGTAVMYGSGTSWDVISVTMTNNGTGYTSAPTVTFTGSNQTKAPNAVAEITLAGSTNNQTVLNSAGTGAVVLNGSNNAGTGGTVFGSGGSSATTVALIDGYGNAIFDGTLTVSGGSIFQSSAEVRNSLDAESDFSLWSGLTATQKESFTYKDYTGASQWYMEKDQYNNWMLNSAIDGLDHFKAFPNGDDYIDAGSGGGVRINYENGSGSGFTVYGGNSSTVYMSLTAANAVKIPGLASGSGYNCLQIDNSGWVTNTGTACRTGSGNGNGTVTQVGLTLPSDFNVSGSPITGSGTFTVTRANESANTFLAGPCSGNPVVPVYRALCASDIPTLSQYETVTAAALLAPLASPTFTGSPVVPGYETTAAAALLAPLASPTFTGTPVIPGYETTTAAALLAPRASPTFTGTPVVPGYLTTVNAASTYAPLASPTFTGTPVVPGYLTTSAAASVYAPLNSPTFTGNVTTHANNAASQDYVIIQPGTGGTDYIGALEFANYAGTSQWEIRKDASNTFRLRDTVNSVDRVIQYAGTQTEINSGGSSSVAINNTSASGTGGFIVYEGGTNYNTQAFSVASNGNAAVTGTLAANAATITNTLSAATIKDTGILAAYLVGTDGSGDLISETMSGDATLGSGGSLTLAAVNSSIGSFGSSTAIPVITVNGKGLITSVSTVAVATPAGGLTGTSLPSTIVTSYLTAVGTISTGVWQGTPVANAYLANSSVTVAGQGCTLGSSCAIAAANLSNGASGTGAVALVGAPTFTGNTTTFANGAASQDYLVLQPGTGGTDQIGALEFANYAGASQWEVRKDASNTFRIRDTVNSVDRFIQYAGSQTQINSGGTSSVAINGASSSGSGGFVVYEGGLNYTTLAFAVTSSGNANVAGIITAAGVKDTAILSAYLLGTDSSGDVLAETMSGDATLGSGGALTLASVNSSSAGSFGSSTAIPTFTVNAKGLITVAGSTAVVAPAGTLTGTVLASTVVTSSLTAVGTIGTGIWQGTAIGVGYGGLNTSTTPSAGQILIAQSATAYAPETVSGDCTVTSAGAFTCLKANGTTFGTGAFAVIANYATLASPAFTGTPNAPTQTTGDNTTDLATDAFVNASITAGGFLTTSSASSTYAPKASPTFTGTATMPTETTVASGNMHLDAGTGAYYVCVNCDNNTGTSGFVVQNGTSSSPTTEFQVTGSGNTTATGYLSSKGWFGNYTASYTAGAAAGTSPTIACATTHTCTNIQGTYSIKTGTSPTTGTLVTINLNHTQNNILDCSSDLWLPGTGHILTYELTNSTTSTIVVTLDAALTASTTYYFTYVCGSY